MTSSDTRSCSRTNVGISEIVFSEKNVKKKWIIGARRLTASYAEKDDIHIALLCFSRKIVIFFRGKSSFFSAENRHFFYEKSSFFRRKLVKIAENNLRRNFFIECVMRQSKKRKR
jgi:hypothetical protein